MKNKLTNVKSVLFVCMGNICRSPTAEAVFRRYAELEGVEISIDSAGTIGHHEGALPDRRARAAGEERGFSFDGISARKVQSQDFEQYDLILAADRQNLMDLQQICPSHLANKLTLILAFGGRDEDEVPDPYYGGEQGFEQVLDLLEDSCADLVLKLASRS